MQRTLALRLAHQIVNLLRAHSAVFFCALQGRIQRGIAGRLLVGVHHGRRHLLGSLGDAAVLRQPGQRHGQRLGHVDHGRSHRPADVLRKQQSTDLLGLLLRVLDVLHQIHRVVLQFTLLLRNRVGGIGHFSSVQVLRCLPCVGVHKPGQHAPGVFAETGDTLALNQSLHRAAAALGQLDVLLIRRVAIEAHHPAKQRHRFRRYP